MPALIHTKGTPEAKAHAEAARMAWKKNGAPKYGTLQVRKDLQEKLARLEQQREDAINPKYEAHKRLDLKSIEGQIRQTNQLLERITPNLAGMSVKQKNALYKRAKEIEEIIIVDMPTRDEMKGRPVTVRGNPVGGRREEPSIVKKHMAWLAKNETLVKEWKQIQRRIDPDNPELPNVERLRPIH